MTKTTIEWCDSTVNFWSGCAKVSPGCANCYAEALSNRNQGPIGKWGPGAPRKLHESAFKLAHRLNRKPWVCNRCGDAWVNRPLGSHRCDCGASGDMFNRRRIFSLSLGDWLDPEVPVECLAWMLDTIRQCTDVIWMLLTKRPEWFVRRMLEVATNVTREDGRPKIQTANMARWWLDGIAPSNVAIGASVEDQQRADERIPHLLCIPARWRFLSLEPLLGPVDIAVDLMRRTRLSDRSVPGIDLIIIGGESGPKARPCNVEWVRYLVRQGRDAGVPVFVKQLGAFPIVGPCQPDGALSYSRLSLRDPKGGDLAEWPEDLRVREQPEWGA